VSRQGSIDWCCMPRIDSASVFGRLLDWDDGGHCGLSPSLAPNSMMREYIDDSLVLRTTYRTDDGDATVTDCFTMRTGGGRNPDRRLLRIVEGVSGCVPFDLRVRARFDYGSLRPWIRRHGYRLFTAIGGNDALVVSTDAPIEPEDHHDLVGYFEVSAGDRVRLSLAWVPPEEIDPNPPDQPGAHSLDDQLQETLTWWHRWSTKLQAEGGPHIAECRRSAMVLKGLVYAPTGAVAAAATTSLPEDEGGVRNWDYRYSWIRDSQFTVRSLGELGGVEEADGFRRFVERSAAGNADALQLMYGLGGERRLPEFELDHLEGYRGSQPVRIGNAASTQLQLDVFGYLLDLAWRWHRRGQSPDDDYWRFLTSCIDKASECWMEPDSGIWEKRGDPIHHVYSKVMCWVTLHRGLQLAEECLRAAPTEKWTKARDEVHDTIESRGYDEERGVYVAAFDSNELDASLLFLPTMGYIAWDDPKMIRTTDAVREDLEVDGLLIRYRSADGVAGDDHPFIACTFALAECLAHQGRMSDAQLVFDRASATANDLGLFSEEFDTVTHQMLGNFPQGLSHLAHISAALAIDSRLH
jgi:GH15 family glucan-1,4-alpha-glucosidase